MILNPMSYRLGVTAILATFATAASADSIRFDRIDTDDDGALSASELTAAFGAENAERYLAYADGNGDGFVVPVEIRQARQGAREILVENRQDRRDDRQDTREDRRDERQDTREDRRDERQDRREDRQDARDDSDGS